VKPLLNGVRVSLNAAAAVTARLSLTGDTAPAGIEEPTGASARASATATTRTIRPTRGKSDEPVLAMDILPVRSRGEVVDKNDRSVR
jgi:hypothetical protein